MTIQEFKTLFLGDKHFDNGKYPEMLDQAGVFYVSVKSRNRCEYLACFDNGVLSVVKLFFGFLHNQDAYIATDVLDVIFMIDSLRASKKFCHIMKNHFLRDLEKSPVFDTRMYHLRVDDIFAAQSIIEYYQLKDKN